MSCQRGVAEFCPEAALVAFVSVVELDVDAPPEAPDCEEPALP
jgi:hypothetical protein